MKMLTNTIIPLILLGILPSTTFSFTCHHQTRHVVDIRNDDKKRMLPMVNVGMTDYEFFSKSVIPGPIQNAFREDVVIDPDYRLTGAFVLASVAIFNLYPATTSFSGYSVPVEFLTLPGLSAVLHLWFGLFLADRAYRIRCVFHGNHFQMKNFRDEKGNPLENGKSMNSRAKNYVVGGENKWSCDSFVNYEFWPSIHMPILVYFKETQTPKHKWKTGPGKLDPNPGTGMVHFFPGFGNTYQLRDEFEARGCSKK